MKINLMRIDDRLIHGQIVTAWIAYANADRILVVDDLVANDEFQQTLLKMATPANVKLTMVSEEEARSLIKEDQSDEPSFLIVRGVQQALALIENGLDIASLNVGNINMKKGKTKILSSLWLDEQEVAAFRKLAALQVKLDVRTVPTDRSQDAIELIDKHFR
ncbi:PTS system, N-acetylgalactosamine-specific IIB component/PTS system, sorbose-specific IIB component/PTS system, galactosamine-specific IIB component [Seinonella peptonophila]|uniref:PTS system, N-acetylgalactosamine-specific IIB component/PTS system, sorbose-specific IIB component/PTS system, galactosamine-specific IIB component n=1 Tax=Seinonella peptonophila TaxID=112248 RepID=A0A1M4XKV9_9BACL|nr:PTS sugar transporter subunit IIB [Seinonella peptonophila]SHE94247.1 PTS system, N-acetylgalactosamine-specific IIB component/PTS system, sorbose-specific IIB component/PTS system, galactosamine-specific IIB component [Seinonella peptonophila]